jgi:hypothetical protein
MSKRYHPPATNKIWYLPSDTVKVICGQEGLHAELKFFHRILKQNGYGNRQAIYPLEGVTTRRGNYTFFFFYLDGFFFFIWFVRLLALRPPLACCASLGWWWKWLWRSRWNVDWQRKPKFSEKTCLSATFVHHKIPHDQTRDWTRPAAVGSRRLTAWVMTWQLLSWRIGLSSLCPFRIN